MQMQIVNQQQDVSIKWNILKGASTEREDFSRADKFHVFLQSDDDKIHIDDPEPTINTDGSLQFTISKKLNLVAGIYSIKCVWIKNKNKNIPSFAEKLNLFAVTNNDNEATNPNASTLELIVTSHVYSYGYDGLSAYETAIFYGTTTSLSEKEWVQIRASEVEENQIKDGAITTKKLADEAVTTAKLADYEAGDEDKQGVTTAKLADKAVTTDKIQNNAVTTAKIEDYTDGSDVPTGVTTEKIANGAVTTNKLEDYDSAITSRVTGVTTAKIADKAVTTEKLANYVSGSSTMQGVTTAKIADKAVTTDKIGSQAVVTDKLADYVEDDDEKRGVTTDKLANLSVTTAKLADYVPNDEEKRGVTTAKIADKAVTTSKIKDGAVTTAKIEDYDKDSAAQTGVTTAKIADKAVTTAKLQDYTEGDTGVTTAKIADKAVTNAKIADKTIENGKFADKTIENGKIKDKTLENGKFADKTIENGKIADGTITNDKLAGNIDGSKIADNTIDATTKIIDGTIDGKKIADNTIDATTKIIDGTIDGKKIADYVEGSAVQTGITTEKIADGAVTNDKLAGEAITDDKIAEGALEKFETEQSERLTELAQKVDGTPNYTEGYYIGSDGNLIKNEDYCVTAKIALDDTIYGNGITFFYGTYLAEARLCFFKGDTLVNAAACSKDNYFRILASTSSAITTAKSGGADNFRFSFYKGYDAKATSGDNTIYKAAVTDGIASDVNTLKSNVSSLESRADEAESKIGANTDAIESIKDVDTEQNEKLEDLVQKVDGTEDTVYTKEMAYSTDSYINPATNIECDIKSGETFVVTFEGYENITGNVTLYWSADGSTRNSLGSDLPKNERTLTASQDYKYIHFYVAPASIADSGTLKATITIKRAKEGLIGSVADLTDSIENLKADNTRNFEYSTKTFDSTNFTSSNNWRSYEDGSVQSQYSAGAYMLTIKSSNLLSIKANLGCNSSNSAAIIFSSQEDPEAGFLGAVQFISGVNEYNVTSIPTGTKYIFVYNRKGSLETPTCEITEFASALEKVNELEDNVVDKDEFAELADEVSSIVGSGKTSYYGDKIDISITEKKFKCGVETLAEHTYGDGLGEYTMGCQSMAIYNGKIFNFIDTSLGKGFCWICDLEGNSIQFVADIPEGFPSCHCNQASFTDVFYDSADEYPLLLISRGSYPSTDLSSAKIEVIRITETGGVFSFTLISEISVMNPLAGNNGSWAYDKNTHRLIGHLQYPSDWRFGNETYRIIGQLWHGTLMHPFTGETPAKICIATTEQAAVDATITLNVCGKSTSVDVKAGDTIPIGALSVDVAEYSKRTVDVTTSQTASAFASAIRYFAMTSDGKVLYEINEVGVFACFDLPSLLTDVEVASDDVHVTSVYPDYFIYQGGSYHGGRYYIPIQNYTKINGMPTTYTGHIVAAFDINSGRVLSAVPTDAKENEGCEIYEGAMYVNSKNGSATSATTTPCFTLQKFIF